MGVIHIKVHDLTLDPANPIDLASLPPEEVLRLIRESFGFLDESTDISIDGDDLVIQYAEQEPSKLQNVMESYERGIKEARRGDYAKAIKYFKRALVIAPYHLDARRNMAMAFLERGDVAKAKELLLECMRLHPDDGWTYVLLGNIANKNEGALDTAEFFYEKGMSITPEDHFLLNNYAALLLEQGKLERSRDLFQKALSFDPSYPNTYAGLAMLERKAGNLEAGLARLEEMFDRECSGDIRSRPVYEQGRALYLTMMQELAEKNRDGMMAAVMARKVFLEESLGIPIIISQDESLQNATASIQMAWRHHRPEHRILWRGQNPSFLPHLLTHEMEHIVLEAEARKVMRNRTFLTTAESRERAILSIRDHIKFLSQQGYPEDAINGLIQQIVQGTALQLYNCPLDMYVESRLFQNVPAIRASQYASLHRIYGEGLRVISDKEIRKLTPDNIYKACVTMNCASALFLDHLFGSRTAYAEPYRSTRNFETGKRLFELWREQEPQHVPGDEYLLIDEYARILGLADWCEWNLDVGESTPEEPEEERTKFDNRQDEILIYCVEALRRYEAMSPASVAGVAREIALLGAGGIDYRTPGRVYEIPSLPGEKFSGLQLLCLMHVGMKKTNPAWDTGLDMDEEFRMAVEMFRNKPQ